MLKAKGDWIPLNRFDFFLPAYIFVVDNENFKTCVERGVCDCPRHESPKIDAKAITDLAEIKSGDNVGSYMKGIGIYGFSFIQASQ